ncbi:hypothetical protein [Shewanella sp. A22]
MDEEKCRLLADFIISRGSKNEPASSDEMKLALNLHSLLMKWSDEKSSTCEEVIAKLFVRSMMHSECNPITKAFKSCKPEKKPNKRPSVSLHESVSILLFARANGIKAAGREFGLTPSTIRYRVKKVASALRLTKEDLLNTDSKIYDSPELDEMLQSMRKHWIETNQQGGE